MDTNDKSGSQAENKKTFMIAGAAVAVIVIGAGLLMAVQGGKGDIEMPQTTVTATQIEEQAGRAMETMEGAAAQMQEDAADAMDQAGEAAEDAAAAVQEAMEDVQEDVMPPESKKASCEGYDGAVGQRFSGRMMTEYGRPFQIVQPGAQPEADAEGEEPRVQVFVDDDRIITDVKCE